MKRLVPLLLLSLFIVSCGGGSSRGISCDKDYWDGAVGTCLPKGWIVVDRETLRQRGVPEETIVAFQSEEPVSGQFPTVVVTREQLPQASTPEKYSEASVRSISVLPGYERVDMRAIEIDGEEVQLHIFTAKPVEEEPMRRFYQVSTAIENLGYSATAVVPVSISGNVEKELMLVLERMTFIEPVKEE